MPSIAKNFCGKFLRNKLFQPSPLSFSDFFRVPPRRSVGNATSLSLDGEKNVIKVTIEKEGGPLKLSWSKKASDFTLYHHEWLRFNCQCAQCRQPHSNQRILDCNQIPKNIELFSAEVQGKKLQLGWRQDEHQGFIDLQWLRELKDYRELKPEPFEAENLPRFNHALLEKTDLFQSILRNGFAIVYNLPTVAGTVKNFVETVFQLPVQRTVYGETFDVISTPKPINVAYSNAELKPHIDLVYYESPPGLQLLHCLRFDETVEGGESTLVDGFWAAEELRRRHPEHFEKLCRTPVTFEKIHFDRNWPVHMRYRRPHVVVNEVQEITGIFWAPQFEGALMIPVEEMSSYFDAYKTFASLIETCSKKLEFRLKPGEMLVFNNRRLLHGRKEFSVSEGIRHFEGCYVNIDEFKSQVQVDFIKKGISTNVPRVANQSY